MNLILMKIAGLALIVEGSLDPENVCTILGCRAGVLSDVEDQVLHCHTRIWMNISYRPTPCCKT